MFPDMLQVSKRVTSFQDGIVPRCFDLIVIQSTVRMTLINSNFFLCLWKLLAESHKIIRARLAPRWRSSFGGHCTISGD